jgi:tetratricopeptide (TPR) repeat protein
MRPANPPGQLIPPPAYPAAGANQAGAAPNQMRQAAPTQRDIANAEAMVQQAREKAASAQTMADYNDLVQLCMKAKKAPISQNSALYLDQLLGWTYNRRGESYLEKSGALVTEGKKSEAKKLDAQALAEFDRAVKYDPSRWKAYHNRGVCYASSGRSDLAIVDFTRALKLNPEHTNAWFNRAEVHYDRREYDHAIADYSEVVRMKPADVAAYTGRGHSYYQLARYREALADY